MEQSHILAFIDSTRSVFETMLQLAVEVGTPVRGDHPDSSVDVSAIIGMTGDINGAVVLSSKRETANRLVSILCGADVGDDVDDMSDALGELVNMIAGGASARIEEISISNSCPSVVFGPQHSVHGTKDLVRVSIPCSCDCGEFYVEVSVRQSADVLQHQAAGASAEVASTVRSTVGGQFDEDSSR